MMIFYFYLVCFTFSISYSVLLFHSVYVLQFLRIFLVFFLIFFLKPLISIVEKLLYTYQSVQFGHSVMSDSLWPHELQHARLSCPSPTSRVCSNSCPSSQWCHQTILSSVIPFSSCLQSAYWAPTSLGSSSFSVTSFCLFIQFMGFSRQEYWSSLLLINPSNEYPGLISFRMDWLDLLEVQGTLKSLHQHHSSKASVLQCSAFLIVQLSHPYMTTGKIIALNRWTFVDKVCLCFLICCLGWS